MKIDPVHLVFTTKYHIKGLDHNQIQWIRRQRHKSQKYTNIEIYIYITDKE